MLRDDAVVYGIVGLLPLVQVAGVDLLPDARVHLLIVIRMDDAAESALRVSEEVIVIGNFWQDQIADVEGRESNFLLHIFPFATTMQS